MNEEYDFDKLSDFAKDRAYMKNEGIDPYPVWLKNNNFPIIKIHSFDPLEIEKMVDRQMEYIKWLIERCQEDEHSMNPAGRHVADFGYDLIRRRWDVLAKLQNPISRLFKKEKLRKLYFFLSDRIKHFSFLEEKILKMGGEEEKL